MREATVASTRSCFAARLREVRVGDGAAVTGEKYPACSTVGIVKVKRSPGPRSPPRRGLRVPPRFPCRWLSPGRYPLYAFRHLSGRTSRIGGEGSPQGCPGIRLIPISLRKLPQWRRSPGWRRTPASSSPTWQVDYPAPGSYAACPPSPREGLPRCRCCACSFRCKRSSLPR